MPVISGKVYVNHWQNAQNIKLTYSPKAEQ